MSEENLRPPVWVGHIALGTPDLEGTCRFMLELGMREIVHGDQIAVLELRGGTHLILLPSEGAESGPAPFDLMVEDLAATHRDLEAKGLEPSSIAKKEFHTSFTVRSPSGHLITFNSSHVSELPV